MKTRNTLTLIIAGLVAGPLTADVVRLYDFADSPSTTGFTFIKDGTNGGVTWGGEIAALEPDAEAAMGVPGAFRIWSYESAGYSRADATIELDAGVTGGMRVSFKAFNQNYFWVESGLRKVAVRMANPGVAADVINGSSANYQNMLEVFTDGTVGGAWNRVNETGVAEPRLVVDDGAGTPEPVTLSAHTFDLVVNSSPTETFTYVVHSVERTLDPLKVDLFVDGVLVTPAANPNGSNFENKAYFNTELGIGTISFTTASSSHSETDFVLDKAYIYTGEDVNDGTTPQESPLANLLGSSDSLGQDFYYSSRLGLYWSDAVNDWVWSHHSWLYVAAADSTSVWLYEPVGDSWLYATTDSAGYVYVVGSGWAWWELNGQFTAL